MAFATIAGLPVQVGLYTALVPMVIYALMGTSRPLSVSTTTTIAILAAAQLGGTVPRGERGGTGGGQRDARHPGRRHPRARLAAAARVRRQLHLGPGPRRLQDRHRRGDRRGPDPQAAGHPHPEGGVLPGPRSPSAQPPARDLDPDAAARRRHPRAAVRPGALRAAAPAPLIAVAVGIAACGLLGLPQIGRDDGRRHPARAAVARLAATSAWSVRCGRAQWASPS